MIFKQNIYKFIFYFFKFCVIMEMYNVFTVTFLPKGIT